MPAGTVKHRVENIEKEGARVCVTDMNYDDTVRFAAGEAQKNGWTIVQAGVGSMAAAVLGYYANQMNRDCPATYILESDQADCFYHSALADDGKLRGVGGALNTIMAGLACGEANPFAWEILRDFSQGFISCSDGVAVRGMQLLAHPISGDSPIVSGESGALGPGLVHCLMMDPKFSDLKEKMRLNRESSVLCFSTEGDTDPENYQQIIQQIIQQSGA